MMIRVVLMRLTLMILMMINHQREEKKNKKKEKKKEKERKKKDKKKKDKKKGAPVIPVLLGPDEQITDNVEISTTKQINGNKSNHVNGGKKGGGSEPVNLLGFAGMMDPPVQQQQPSNSNNIDPLGDLLGLGGNTSNNNNQQQRP